MPKQLKKEADKAATDKAYIRLAKWCAPRCGRIADRLAQVVAIVFVLATSYKYVQTWLETHQISQSGSVAAGIMLVALALYLIVRKR